VVKSPVILIALAVMTAIFFSGCEKKVVLKEGQQAPVFDLTDVDGNNWRLEDLGGSVVLINFWATWCSSCTSEMPSLQRLFHETEEETGLVILTIIFKDDPYKAYAYVKSNNYGFPVLKDPDGLVAEAFGLTGVPETFVIGKNGILRKKVIGPATFDAPEVIAYLERLTRE
jgi:peroxiredoxin